MWGVGRGEGGARREVDDGVFWRGEEVVGRIDGIGETGSQYSEGCEGMEKQGCGEVVEERGTLRSFIHCEQ